MADPNALEGKSPAQTYNDLLHINNLNNGANTSLQTIYFGDGSASTIQMGTSSFAADCNRARITKPTLLQPSEEAVSYTHGASGPYVVDLSDGQTFNINLDDSITSMTVSGLPSDDGVERAIEITFLLTQGGAGSNTVTWPAGTKWSGGTAPTLTTTIGRTDMIKILTVDNGTSWYGHTVALDLQ